MSDSDRTLLFKAREGDGGALAELLARSRPSLERYVQARVLGAARGTCETEDVVEETTLRALQKLEHFEWRDERSFQRWLCAIAQRVILEHARRRRRLPGQLGQEPAAPTLAASRLLRREERFRRLEGALDGLSDSHREVIFLARIEGLKIREIAERLGRSPEAVKKLLSRGLEKLKEAFGETESFHLPDRRLRRKDPTDDAR